MLATFIDWPKCTKLNMSFLLFPSSNNKYSDKRSPKLLLANVLEPATTHIVLDLVINFKIINHR